MKQNDRGIMCRKDGYIVGYGHLDVIDNNYDYFPIPDNFPPKPTADFKLINEYRKLKYKYINGEIIEEYEVLSSDEIKVYDFQKTYPIEKRMEIQDSALSALINGDSTSQEYIDYKIAKDAYKIAETSLKSK